MAKIRNRKGQGLVEYALIIAGVALIAAVAVSMFGHKVTDLIGTVAAILPGAHTDDNAAITAGHLLETQTVGNVISLDVQGIMTNGNGTDRINNNLFGTTGEPTGDSPLVVETNPNGQ
jgi:Flp pilus assembly pilin Flp